LIQDLLESDPSKNLVELLSLSVVIAIKLDKKDLNDEKRCYFASVFRDIAYTIENEHVANSSLWDAILGKTTVVNHKLDNNV
jgi:hypothetical protein